MGAFPRDAAALDRQWLAAVLDTELVEIRSEAIGVGVGLLGELRRVHLTHAEGHAGPASVVCKWATAEPESRALADGLAYYGREVSWYRDHAEACPLPGPRCFHSEQAEDSTDFVLVLEDLSAHTHPDQLVGLTLEQTTRAVEAVAAMHAHFWERSDLATLGERFLPITHEIYPLVLPDLFASAWEQTLEHASTLVAEPRIRAFGDRWGEALPWMVERLASPATLTHGDLRADNLFFTADGDVRVVDYQILGQAYGAYDPAYLMSQSVPVAVRQEHEQAILDRYHAALTAAGVEGYARDRLWDDYRIALAFCLIYPVAAYDRLDELGNARGRRLVDTMLERSVQAIIDTDADTLVP